MWVIHLRHSAPRRDTNLWAPPLDTVSQKGEGPDYAVQQILQRNKPEIRGTRAILLQPCPVRHGGQNADSQASQANQEGDKGPGDDDRDRRGRYRKVFDADGGVE